MVEEITMWWPSLEKRLGLISVNNREQKGDTAQARIGRQRVSSSLPSIGPLDVASVYYRRLVCKESTFSPSIRPYRCLFSSNNFTPHYYGNSTDVQCCYCICNFYEFFYDMRGTRWRGRGGNYMMIRLTLRLLMSYIYIYGAPILDVSRSHTTTQHSR